MVKTLCAFGGRPFNYVVVAIATDSTPEYVATQVYSLCTPREWCPLVEQQSHESFKDIIIFNGFICFTTI